MRAGLRGRSARRPGWRVSTAAFDSVKVFSATMHQQRSVLGEVVTDWLRDNRGIDVVDRVVTQSSDSEFHCISITIFYNAKRKK